MQTGIKNYEEYWEERIASNKIQQTPIHDQIIKTVKEHTPKSGNILELGVGMGQVYKELLKTHLMRGIEISQTLYDQYTPLMRTGIIMADLNDFDDIPTFGIKFDTIIISMVLHHLRQPIKVLQKIKEQLKPQGKIIIVTPNIGYLPHRIKLFFKGEFPDLSKSHTYFANANQWENIIQRAGLKVIEQKGINAKLSMIRNLNQNLLCGAIFFVTTQ